MTTPWIAGATGLVGRALWAQLPDAVALVRRPQAGAVVVDYGRPDSFAALPAPSHLFIALGTTMAQAGSQAAFQAVDFDAVLTVARAARDRGATHCGMVSALGADARSEVFYTRVKGQAEAAVIQALPVIESLVTKLPPIDPTPGGKVVALRANRP